MTNEEIIELEYTIASYLPRIKVNENYKFLWEKAFKEYNAEHDVQLKMNCRPCYFKVLMFHKKRVNSTLHD